MWLDETLETSEWFVVAHRVGGDLHVGFAPPGFGAEADQYIVGKFKETGGRRLDNTAAETAQAWDQNERSVAISTN